MSDAYSFGSNDDDTIGPPTPLKKFRAKYYEEMAQKPQVYRKLMALTQAEVGNQGPEAQQAFLETVFNRAAARGQTLDEAMQLVSKGGYYPGLGDYNKVSAETQTGYGDLLNQVRSGSNVGNYATGNASGTVGFNKGPQVAEYGGERYGIEGPDLKTMQGIAGGTIDPLEAQASTFDPTGRKRMANGDQQGILPLLGMQNQQPQGLLGALGDPETMSYIAMMLKGFNPYSNLDPNSMLSAAHTNALRKQALMQQEAERATDNRRADARLDLDKQRFGLTQREYDEQRAEAQRQQKAREDLYGNLPGSTAQTLDPSATEPTTEYDKIRERIKYFEDRMGALSPKDKDAAQKQIDLLNKRLQPSATELKQYDTSSGNLPQLESLKAGLERAKELVPQAAGSAITTYANKMAAWIGSRRPEVLATVELDRKMQELALTELKKLLPGPASNRDVDIIRGIASDPAMPPDEKSRRIGDVLTRVEAQIAKERGVVKRFQQKEGTYKPEDAESGGGGTAIGGGWTVREK